VGSTAVRAEKVAGAAVVSTGAREAAGGPVATTGATEADGAGATLGATAVDTAPLLRGVGSCRAVCTSRLQAGVGRLAGALLADGTRPLGGIGPYGGLTRTALSFSSSKNPTTATRTTARPARRRASSSHSRHSRQPISLSRPRWLLQGSPCSRRRTSSQRRSNR